MSIKTLAWGGMIVAIALLSSGCIVGIGDGRGEPRRATLGQELVDLQKARDAGAVTPEEFAAQKKKLLAQ